MSSCMSCAGSWRTICTALRESEAVAKGTHCRQHLFSLSFNPPDTERVSVAQFEAAIARAETSLGLSGHARAVIFHEKEGNDNIYGRDFTTGIDTIHGLAGNDTIYGYQGVDILYGDDGNDYIEGGYGNDELYGGSAVDSLRGGYGEDILDGGDGRGNRQRRKLFDLFCLKRAEGEALRLGATWN